MEKRPKILVVDDDVRNLSLMEAMLIPAGHEVLLARDGEEGLEKARELHPDVILLDVMMPKLDGFEVARRLKENVETQIIPIVMVTALQEVEDRIKALNAGADDFLTKPVEKTELRARVQSLLKVKAYNDHMRSYQKELENEVAKRTEQLKQAFEVIKSASLETIILLSRAAEYRDEDTGAHIQRMSHYAEAIARQMRLDAGMVETILYASPMHDIGKIGIPDRILLKPAKLDRDEWEIMKQHAAIGAGILKGSDTEFITLGRIIALTHHEKWDGSGYPVGLKASAIPLAGRITAIADVFDALTSKRPYKEPFSLDKSFSIIKEERDRHFDPDVVDAFLKIENEIVSIKDRYNDQQESLLVQMAGNRENQSGHNEKKKEI
jgi:putative two-component system response regulator